ncbi:hypothetical protein AQI96_39970 [Streptomyces canus]|nr:hypothetical protein AQI96_39970 [Streptomyces canus]
MSRRTFLGAAGAATAATALPVLPGFSGLLSQAAAADTQTNLSKMVDMRFGMFDHFSMGTFTNQEWAEPNQSPAPFAPPSVNCAQWADAAAAAKMSYGILTTKHHDGFALWPSAYGTQNVANSSYKQDVVRAYCDAFRAKGLKVGFYYSIWDRTFGVLAWESRQSGRRQGHHARADPDHDRFDVGKAPDERLVREQPVHARSWLVVPHTAGHDQHIGVLR